MTDFNVAPSADKLFLRDYDSKAATRLVYPTLPYPESMRIRTIFVNYASNTHSLVRVTRGLAAQMFGFTLHYGAMTRAEFSPIETFLERQRGRYKTFLFQPSPVYLTPQGTVAGSTPLVDGNGQAGEVVRVRGCAASTLVLKAGDFLRFANHAKVYKAVEDARSDAAGEMSIQISPPLMATISDGEEAKISGLAFTVAQNGDVRETELNAPNVFLFDVDLVEVPKNG